MTYKAYFRIGTKKMVMVIDAADEYDAEYKIRNKIKVDRIELVQDNDDVEFLKNIFGIK